MIRRTVGINRIVAIFAFGIDITKSNLLPGLNLLFNGTFGKAYLPFPMRNRQVQPLTRGDKHTLVGTRLQINPPIFKFTAVIMATWVTGP